MLSLENEQVKYPLIIEVPEDYWTITTTTNEFDIEYDDGNN